jgi:hypothetical protein
MCFQPSKNGYYVMMINPRKKVSEVALLHDLTCSAVTSQVNKQTVVPKVAPLHNVVLEFVRVKKVLHSCKNLGHKEHIQSSGIISKPNCPARQHLAQQKSALFDCLDG